MIMGVLRPVLISVLLALAASSASAQEEAGSAIDAETSGLQPTETFSVSPEDLDRCGGPCPTKRPRTTTTSECSDKSEPTSSASESGGSSTFEPSSTSAESSDTGSPTSCDSCEPTETEPAPSETEPAPSETETATQCDECEPPSTSSEVAEPSTTPTEPDCPDGCTASPPPAPTTSDTPPPKPEWPTCDNECPITTSVPPPPKPTAECPPRPDCQSPQYKRYYDFGFRSGTNLVGVLLQGHDDCADVSNTVRTLQDNAPSYPTTMDNSPSLYCRQLGVYTGFVGAVDGFEKRCAVQCRDDGQQIGSQAAYLLCNLPTARVARIDLCEISFDAGCALAFEQTVQEYCPGEMNSDRYKEVKDRVCAFKAPQ